jgi:hypothetical protein
MTEEELMELLTKQNRAEHIPKHFDDQLMSISFTLGEWRTILNCIVNDDKASGNSFMKTGLILREISNKMLKKYRRESRKR